MNHEHVSMKECMLYLNSKLLNPTQSQFEVLSPIISKMSECPTCLAICHKYKELGNWLESEIELGKDKELGRWLESEMEPAKERGAEVTESLTEDILRAIEGAKQGVWEVGNKLIDSFFVQPRLEWAVMRSDCDNDLEREGTDIKIHDVGDGFFSFALEKETDMSIQDFNIKEIPQDLIDDHTVVKLVIKRVDDEQQAEISVGVLNYQFSPGQISFKDVCLPEGVYVFYLTWNKGGR